MAKDTFTGPLEQVDACCWRIPKSYKQGMLVDGLIFSNEKLMAQLKKDQAPEQVANVAFLPGIQLASLAMPDIHWGYGFCIGGVCATDPDEGGVISPGGVGYDINCLSEKSLILSSFGYTRRISDMAGEWQQARLACFNLQQEKATTTEVQLWFAQKPKAPVLRVVTETGDEIEATADHPFWTPDGMVALGQLRSGDRIAQVGFQGVPYEEPAERVLVSEGDLIAQWKNQNKALAGNGLGQMLDFLKQRGLLPLTSTSPALPYLCKILGFVFGDGHLHFVGGMGKGVTAFYGQPDDLETLRADLVQVGVTPSRVYSRERSHAIQTLYGEYQFESQENHIKVIGSGFALLLACLGAPIGDKAKQAYSVPRWLEAAPLWQKRLFLAALFGSELTTPATISGHDTVFGAPTLSMNKRSEFVEGGRQFLEQISAWLTEFGVRTQSLLCDTSYHDKEGEVSLRLRLILSPKSDSLLNLWSRIGYDYNRKRSNLAALAVQYLKHKQNHLDRRQETAQLTRRLACQDVPRRQIMGQLVGAGINQRFIERALYGKSESIPRVGEQFPTFSEFCTSASTNSMPTGMVWERIASIEPVPDFDGNVYDFTVAHPDHNFIANGFVVSNCGVRLVRSNLYYQDVKRNLRQLVEALFRNVPTGAGRSGKYHFNHKELKQLMASGSSFLLNRDLATQSDIDFTEAHGKLDGADPEEVSQQALRRGEDQCGTLGSGNHFLEVQVVDHVFDEEAAQVIGLEKDLVCVMIHSGSRGLGYQVCDDALAMLRKVPERYGIALPDRQLACAPVDSPEGKRYIGAMRAAANFAWCNRQLLMMQAREVFAQIFGRSWQELGMSLVYDVAHNIAKFEEHLINGKRKRVWVHRKGATRAFPPQHPEIPVQYRAIGQPVIIPGDMGRASWVLVGQPGSMERTFGTTCHGAGRALSRTAAFKEAAGRRIDKELEARGVIARAQSLRGLAEEQPKAYKDVDDVVEVVHQAGLSKKVARMRPIGVIKG